MAFAGFFSSRLRLISADQGGSHMPMERWFVSASSIELSAGVDKKMGMGSTELEDLKTFCIAEGGDIGDDDCIYIQSIDMLYAIHGGY